MFCSRLPSLVVVAQTVLEIFDWEVLGNSPIFSKSADNDFPQNLTECMGVASSTKPGSMNDIVGADFL